MLAVQDGMQVVFGSSSQSDHLMALGRFVQADSVIPGLTRKATVLTCPIPKSLLMQAGLHYIRRIIYPGNNPGFAYLHPLVSLVYLVVFLLYGRKLCGFTLP